MARYAHEHLGLLCWTGPPTGEFAAIILKDEYASDLPVDRFLDRELSWLAFNKRVLDLAEDTGLPLLERTKFLAIFASNLDEFLWSGSPVSSDVLQPVLLFEQPVD